MPGLDLSSAQTGLCLIIGAVIGWKAGRRITFIFGVVGCVSSIIETVAGVLDHSPGQVVVDGSLAVACGWFAWHEWRNRPPRNRRKTPRAFGAKSRARLTALLRNLNPRPAGTRAPVPSPLRLGAA